MTRGRPCDYSDLSYERPRGGSGIQWGTERLYTDHRFHTGTDYTQDYGHDLLTGAAYERKDHAQLNAEGRAILKTGHYVPPHEPPSEDYPLVFTTGAPSTTSTRAPRRAARVS